MKPELPEFAHTDVHAQFLDCIALVRDVLHALSLLNLKPGQSNL